MAYSILMTHFSSSSWLIIFPRDHDFPHIPHEDWFLVKIYRKTDLSSDDVLFKRDFFINREGAMRRDHLLQKTKSEELGRRREESEERCLRPFFSLHSLSGYNMTKFILSEIQDQNTYRVFLTKESWQGPCNSLPIS